MKTLRVFVFAGICATLIYFLWAYGPGLFTQSLPHYGSVSTFELTDSSGQRFSSQQLSGKVWVANFIFTSCSGPCPLMTAEMRSLQKHYSQKANDIDFVSISVDPDTDTPEQLRTYAQKYNADLSHWHFLTGEMESIVTVARDIFKVQAGGEDPNLHSTRFILIDQEQNIRGYFDSSEEEFSSKIREAISVLL